MKQHFCPQASNVTIAAVTGEEYDHATLQIKIPLTRTLGSFLRPHHLKMCEQFDQFAWAGSDRIEGRLGWVTARHARERLTKVARTIRFMDLTGLVPTSEEIYGHSTFSPQHRLPGQDHSSTWQDPETNVIVLLDEPYAYVDNLYSDRKNWAESQGFAVHRLSYAGTYRPGHGIVCDLMYRIEHETFVRKMIERIEALDSLPEIEDSWEANLDV